MASVSAKTLRTAEAPQRLGRAWSQVLAAAISAALMAALAAPSVALAQSSPSAPAQAAPASPAPTPAPPPPETAEDEIFFSAEAWRALVAGKTLYYSTAEGLVGREYYPPGGQRAIFEYAADRSCFEGSWREVDGVFCFNYDGEHCFFHLRRGDQIIARQMNGVDQTVVRITDEKLTCAAGLTS